MIIHTMLEMMPQIASREVRDVDSRDEKRGVCEVVEDRRKHAGSRRPRALLQSAPVALQRGGWRRDGPCCLCSLLALDKGGKRKEVQFKNPDQCGFGVNSDRRAGECRVRADNSPADETEMRRIGVGGVRRPILVARDRRAKPSSLRVASHVHPGQPSSQPVNVKERPCRVRF